MTDLNDQPATCTAAQRKTLVIAARKRGHSVEQLRDMVGSKLHDLSAKDASAWIARFGGGDLPNPAGRKPFPYAPKRATSGTIVMIRDEHIEMILRLGVEHFQSWPAFIEWLAGNFHTPLLDPLEKSDMQYAIRRLGTIERAGHVIRVLKDMIARKSEPRPNTEPRPSGSGPKETQRA